jgi:ankyrin repeat protein
MLPYHVKYPIILSVAILLIQPLSAARTLTPDDMLLKGASTANLNQVKRAVRRGAHINASDRYSSKNSTLLLVTRIRGENESQIRCHPKLKIARYLLEKGSKVNTRDISGWTPLMKAAEECNSDMMKFYIDNGADINIQSGKGFTAFDIADFYYKKAVKRKRGPGP